MLPTKLDLVINFTVLARADEVIEYVNPSVTSELWGKKGISYSL